MKELFFWERYGIEVVERGKKKKAAVYLPSFFSNTRLISQNRKVAVAEL